MKKLVSILLASFMAVSFAACGAKESSANGSASQTDSQPASEVVVQIGYEMNPGEPLDQACNKWKELLEEKSGGTFKVELFPSSQLGSKNDLIDQMIAGDAVITIASSAFYADRGVSDMGITFGPYMFENWEQCEKLTSSDWWQEQCTKLEEKNLKIVASNWFFGNRHTLLKEPINSIEDFKGKKIRVPNNNIQIKGTETLGATPVPMPLGEVYTALQQGTIDGLENPLPTLYNGKYHEVAKYLVLDGHIKDFTTWVCGLDFFNSLTEEQQKMLVETAEEAGVYNNEIFEKSEADALEKLKAEGVQVIEINYDEYRKACEPFYSLPEFTSVWSEGLYDKIKSIIE